MTASRPYALLAEITYRCPLHCPYCSNPVTVKSAVPNGEQAEPIALGIAHTTTNNGELTTEEWKRVIREAAELGVLQIGFSGGEPLVRRDLPALIEAARQANLYTNLITSGVGLTDERTRELRDRGLDSVQLSFQADDVDLTDEIAGARAHQEKLKAARRVREAGLPLNLNFVIHRANIDRLVQMIDLAERLEASR